MSMMEMLPDDWNVYHVEGVWFVDRDGGRPGRAYTVAARHVLVEALALAIEAATKGQP